MAVGPGEQLGAIELLDSARAFLRGPYRAIVVDDSGDLVTWRSLRRYREVTLLRNWRRRGLTRLLASLQRAYRHALRSYDFSAILKVDTDALITGPGVDSDILSFLRDHPRAGMIGSRSWPDRTDHVWRRLLEENEAMWGSMLRQAERHGYMAGQALLGGAYVFSRACVAALDAKGYLDLVPTGPRVAEDVTFSMLTQAAGFELHEFAAPNQPFALAWRGLPMPPAQILAQGKKIVHSVKLGPADLSIRTVFARNRRRHVAACAGHLPADTAALAARTRRLRFWLKWRPAAARALREHRAAQARRILRRCARILPARPVIWGGLAASLLPSFLRRPLQFLRRRTISALERLRYHYLRHPR
jgi:hypothetical protein